MSHEMLLALAAAYGVLFGAFVVAAAIFAPVYAVSEFRAHRRTRRLG